MSTSNQPTNPNLLHPNKFILNFTRLPNIQYFCQTIVIPGITVSEMQQTTPFVDVYRPGDKAQYDIFTITFLVDEEMKAWKEVHDWIRGMTFPTDFSEYGNLKNLGGPLFSEVKQPQYSDAFLTLLSNANNPLFRFKFISMFPVSISSFTIDTKESPDTILTAEASFRYAYYDLEKLY